MKLLKNALIMNYKTKSYDLSNIYYENGVIKK